MPSPPVAVVPLRSPGAGGKTRLAPELDPDQRAMLAEAMLTDVLTAVRAAGLTDIVVAAGGTAAAAMASGLGVRVHHDAPGATGLDHVFADVTRVIADRDVLVVAADLPCLSAAEIGALLDLDADVAVAPTNAGGTGGLLRRPGGRMPTAYGPGSAARHVALARDAGARVATLQAVGFRHDVDLWADLLALPGLPVGAATAVVLPRLLGAATRAG